MIKRILSLMIVALIATSAFTQSQILNGGFEDPWDGSGSTIEPKHWNSNKTGAGNATSGPQTCFRDATDKHSGAYSAKIVTGKVAIIGTIVNGSLTTGRVEAPSFSKSDGFIGAYSAVPSTAMVFTGRPDSIIFWIKYSHQGSDFPRVEARLFVDTCFAPEAATSYHGNATPKVIARAQYAGTPGVSFGWTRISLPFVYADNRIPQYILITSTSSGDQTGGSENSTMWLDDFEAIYNPTIKIGSVNAGPYYVSSSTGAGISVPFTLTGTFGVGNIITAQLSNAAGSFASPVSLGTATTTTSGTINGTIPAGTASGAGYKVRVISSNPGLTGDTATISINLVATSVTPSTAQTIAVNTNGTALAVTETPAATSREWKFSTISGSGYQSFSVAQTGTGYTPNFNTTGTYYIVCESTYPGGTVTRSNEVQVVVVSSVIAPASPQSILINTAGTQLTVTETPTGTAREWKYTTTSGSGYQSFSPMQQGTTYTPQFAAAGTYYVICQSTINGINVNSNEVIVSVGSVTLQTTNVTNFPIDFSPNAPTKSVTVTYTVTGGSFNGGNTFTAQLSDANGSFAAPTSIGSVSSTTGGTINASVPNNTPSGIGYRVRVVGSNPNIQGADNGTDLVVDQFNSYVTPAGKQTLVYNTSGNFLTAYESQNATREWKYGTSATGPFQPFNPSETTASYVPSFATPGTYFVVCVSYNTYGDSVTSNAVEIEVTNGTQLSVTNVSGAPFLVSPKANAQGIVTFSSDIIFNAGNVFTAELSDASGSFANPVTIGTLTGTSVAPITVTIPNNTSEGSNYSIRVSSSDPAVNGGQSNPVTVTPFYNSVSPSGAQTATVNVPATTLTVSESHPAAGREWFVSFTGGIAYNPFNPKETGTTINPVFLGSGNAQVICRSVNAANDTITSSHVVFIVEEPNAINDIDKLNAKAWFAGSVLNLSLQGQNDNYTANVYAVNGSLIVSQTVNNNTVSSIDCGNIATGSYIVELVAGEGRKQFRLFKN